MPLLFILFFFSSSNQATQISVSPYSFSLNPDTHQLHTTWEVKGSSVSFTCTFAEVSLVELSWTGKSKELSSGNSWAVTCEEGELGDKMVIEVDVTKFRVQPFRSYKVCINLEDSPTNSHLDEVCTHLFSFEKYVPYMPDDGKKDYFNTVMIDGAKMLTADVQTDSDFLVKIDEIGSEINHFHLTKEEKMGELEDHIVRVKTKDVKYEEADGSESKLLSKLSITEKSDDGKVSNKGNFESVIKNQLEDIENFVRDDFKADFINVENKIMEEIAHTVTHSSSTKSKLELSFILVCLIF